MNNTDIKKFKLFGSFICSLVGHKMKQTDEIQLTHEIGNTKIRGYIGRTKEIKTRHECERCNRTEYNTIYTEMDGFHADSIPEPSLPNPMKAHLDMAKKRSVKQL
jgi:hypothetical protein